MQTLASSREELNRAVLVIEAALSNFPKPENGGSANDQIDFVRVKRMPEAFFEALGKQFKIGDLLVFPQSGLTRPMARRMIDDWVAAGKAKIIEQRRGSAGNKYEKIV